MAVQAMTVRTGYGTVGIVISWYRATLWNGFNALTNVDKCIYKRRPKWHERSPEYKRHYYDWIEFYTVSAIYQPCNGGDY